MQSWPGEDGGDDDDDEEEDDEDEEEEEEDEEDDDDTMMTSWKWWQSEVGPLSQNQRFLYQSDGDCSISQAWHDKRWSWFSL